MPRRRPVGAVRADGAGNHANGHLEVQPIDGSEAAVLLEQFGGPDR
jgi:hypothetical protein